MTWLIDYVFRLYYEGESKKRVIDSKSASIVLYSISLLIFIVPGDFLGKFPGKLRCINQKSSRAVKEPIPDLWLDYSEISGKLNRMRVMKAGEKKNICITWQGVNEAKGEKAFY